MKTQCDRRHWRRWLTAAIFGSAIIGTAGDALAASVPRWTGICSVLTLPDQPFGFDSEFGVKRQDQPNSFDPIVYPYDVNDQNTFTLTPHFTRTFTNKLKSAGVTSLTAEIDTTLDIFYYDQQKNTHQSQFPATTEIVQIPADSPTFSFDAKYTGNFLNLEDKPKGFLYFVELISAEIKFTTQLADGSTPEGPIGSFTANCDIESVSGNSYSYVAEFVFDDPPPVSFRNAGANITTPVGGTGSAALTLVSGLQGGLTIDSVDLQVNGNPPAENVYATSSDCPNVLYYGETCDVTVTVEAYEPITFPRFLVLTVKTSAGDVDAVIESYEEASLEASVERLVFSDVAADGQYQKSFLLRNLIDTPLVVNAVNYQGSGDVIVNSECGETLAPGDACQVDVVYLSDNPAIGTKGRLSVGFTNVNTVNLLIPVYTSVATEGAAEPFSFDKPELSFGTNRAEIIATSNYDDLQVWDIRLDGIVRSYPDITISSQCQRQALNTGESCKVSLLYSGGIDIFGRDDICSGPMIPDTNVGGKLATISEVSDDQKATFFFS